MMFHDVLIFKLIKFCVVGFSGVFVDFGTTWLFKEKAGFNKYVANSIGFVVAATSNYFLNRTWTFHSQNPRIITEYVSFFGIAVVGLLMNNILIFVLTEKFKLNFYLSKLFAIALVTVWNFFMNYLLTFS